MEKFKLALSAALIYLLWFCFASYVASAAALLPLPEPFLSYLAAISSSLVMALSVFLVVRFLLECPFSYLVRKEGRVRKSFFWIPFFTYLATMAVMTAIHAKLDAGKLQFTPPSLTTGLVMAALVLIFNPIQCGAEEFMMRIIPSGLSKRKAVSSLICAFCFLLPHLGNPEVASYPLSAIFYYFIFGYGTTYISLTLSGFEFALAVHMANNLFASLIVGYENSPLPTTPLFTLCDNPADLYSLITLVAALGISAAATIARKNRSAV